MPTPEAVLLAAELLSNGYEDIEGYGELMVIDIGGATTDIHYSKDLVDENIVTHNEYDRLVFKKLGKCFFIASIKPYCVRCSGDFVFEKSSDAG